jgi:hypothetical protein
VALRSVAVTFTEDGIWTPSPGLYGVEVIARGGGGGGSTGNYDLDSWTYFDGTNTFSGTSTHRIGGAGGGGGGASMSRNMIRGSEFTEPIDIVVGAGGLGAVNTHGQFPEFTPGGDGGDSSFGQYFFAGGGLGGGRAFHWQALEGIDQGGPGGYSPIRGGKGATAWTGYTDECNSTNALHSMAGGGGGGCGNGYDEADGSTSGVATTTQLPWSRGGASGPQFGTPNTNGADGVSYPAYWEHLLSGTGGCGGGGDGGFPSGGGGGGNCFGGAAALWHGGNGARGCVTVIEHYVVE